MAAQKKNKNLVNLLPEDEFQATTLGRILHWLLGTFRMIVIATEMIVMLAFLSRFWLDARSNDLSDEMNQKKAVIASYANLEKDFKTTQNRLKIFSAFTSSDKKVTPLINNSTTNLPNDTYINSIIFTNGSLSIDASTLSEQSANIFVARLTNIPTFKNVAITQIGSKQSDPTLNFTVKLDVKGEGSGN